MTQEEMLRNTMRTNRNGMAMVEMAGADGLRDAMGNFQAAFTAMRNACNTTTATSSSSSVGNCSAAASSVSLSSFIGSGEQCFSPMEGSTIMFHRPLPLEPILLHAGMVDGNGSGDHHNVHECHHAQQSQLPAHAGHDRATPAENDDVTAMSLASSVIIFNMALCFHRKAAMLAPGAMRRDCLLKAQSLYLHSHKILYQATMCKPGSLNAAISGFVQRLSSVGPHRAPCGEAAVHGPFLLPFHLSTNLFVGLFCLALLNNLAQIKAILCEPDMHLYLMDLVAVLQFLEQHDVHRCTNDGNSNRQHDDSESRRISCDGVLNIPNNNGSGSGAAAQSSRRNRQILEACRQLIACQLNQTRRNRDQLVAAAAA